MVHNLTAGAAPLTQTVTGRDVSLPRLLPRLGFVKPFRPRFHVITPLGARRAPRPGVSGEPRGLGPIYVRAVPDKLSSDPTSIQSTLFTMPPPAPYADE